MLGHEEEMGIMFLTVEELFKKITSHSTDRDYIIVESSHDSSYDTTQ